MDGSKEVSEAEVSEGIFLLCGAQLDSDGFAWFSKGISDNGYLNKEQFNKVGVSMLIAFQFVLGTACETSAF